MKTTENLPLAGKHPFMLVLPRSKLMSEVSPLNDGRMSLLISEFQLRSSISNIFKLESLSSSANYKKFKHGYLVLSTFKK